MFVMFLKVYHLVMHYYNLVNVTFFFREKIAFLRFAYQWLGL
jgi:hypothetical protein